MQSSQTALGHVLRVRRINEEGLLGLDTINEEGFLGLDTHHPCRQSAQASHLYNFSIAATGLLAHSPTQSTMIKLTCVVAVLACLEGALAQECVRLNSFSAVALDTVDFVPSRAYYDVPNGFVYFKNSANDGARFFDFNAGVIYDKAANGDCVKFTSDNLKLQGLGVKALTAATKDIYLNVIIH
ncbi:hypothetical protein ElyMa_000233900 [Elysia marginata]|uniref:Uncharacterized protein n=1 Tax=Elysia marginata TaxID=1093978 RepID=A0AAV4EZY2_9GAST|nr:hypothetical protein ElyMa_000233900 [Elysia marginata]